MNNPDTSLNSFLVQNSAGAGLPNTSAVDADSNNPFSSASQMLNSEPDFVKGINFNGNAVTIDGNRWVSQKEAVNDGLVIGSNKRYNSRLASSSEIDEDTSNVLNTGIEASTKSRNKDLVISQSLNDGDYQVDLWIMSPSKRERVFDIELEGMTMERVTASGVKGQWEKYSYTTSVKDGQLDLVLDKVRKAPVIAGIEFSSLGDSETPSDPSPGGNPGGDSGDDNPNTPPSTPPVNEDTPDDPDPGSNPTDPDDGGQDPVDAGGDRPDPFDPAPPSPSPTGGKLVWQSGFGRNWESNWPNFQNTTAPENRRVIQDPAGEFDDILRVSYGKNRVGPSGGTQFKSTFEPMESATLEYHVRFKEGFDPVLGGKLPGFTGGLPGRRRENTGGSTPDGTDGWSVRLGFRPARSNPDALAIRAYSYLPPGQQNPAQKNEYVFDEWGNKTFWSGKGKWGVSTHFLNPDNPESGKDLEIKTGEWYKVSLQVTLNTPGETDGFIKGFIEQPGESKSRLAMHIPDLTFRNKGSDLPIDRVFFSTFFGGASDRHKAKRDEHIDFANFKVYSHDK